MGDLEWKHSELKAHFGTHWHGKDSAGLHLNFYVPVNFVTRLTGEYSDRFARSVQHCITLFAQPLFGDESESLELATPLGGTLPLKYFLIHNMCKPKQKIIDGLGGAFERFVREFSQDAFTPCVKESGDYYSAVAFNYHCTGQKDDGQLQLRLTIPSDATSKRFTTFHRIVQTELSLRTQFGKGYVSCNEHPSTYGAGEFSVTGDFAGNVTRPEALEQLDLLFKRAERAITFSA